MPELLRISVVVPEIAIDRDMPLGEDSRCAACKPGCSVDIEQIAVLPFDDIAPEHMLLESGEQHWHVRTVEAHLLPAGRQPGIDAEDSGPFPALETSLELKTRELPRRHRGQER